jgi:hypothetical protein
VEAIAGARGDAKAQQPEVDNINAKGLNSNHAGDDKTQWVNRGHFLLGKAASESTDEAERNSHRIP